MKISIKISIKLPIIVRSRLGQVQVLGRLGIASICGCGKSRKLHQKMWSVQFMNSLATGDYSLSHENGQSIHEMK